MARKTHDQSQAAHARNRLERRNRSEFDAAEHRGLMLAAAVRTAIMVVLVLWVGLDSPNSGVAYVYDVAQPAAFLVLGALQFILVRAQYHTRVLKYVFVAADCALLALLLVAPNPFTPTPIPPAIAMSGSLYLYFFIFLMQSTFSLRPTLVLWCGLCMVLGRLAMLFWFLRQPDVHTNLDLANQRLSTLVAARADPNFLFMGFLTIEILVTLLVSSGLAFVVARSHRLVRSRTAAERSRASLARYFSPNVVDYLSSSPDALATPREEQIAILFADIIGFTKMCEHKKPNEVINLLRDFHSRLGQAVFDNQGTLDKYLGDGLMATFGTPAPGPDDARNALKSAFDMIEALTLWNAERVDAGQDPVRVGIGVNFGPVVAGDIGNARRLEYSVIGDAVNVASRLEHMTRRLGTPLVVSDSLVQALKRDADAKDPMLARLVEGGSQEVQGRDSAVRIWTMAPQAMAQDGRQDRGAPRYRSPV